jgi:hypothetical protein
MSGLVTLSGRVRTARRGHLCSDCLDGIDAGERYHDVRHVYNGRAYTWRSHLGCYALRQTYYACGFEDGLPEGWVSQYELADYTVTEEALACLDRAGVTDDATRLATLRRARILRDEDEEGDDEV